MVIVTPTEEHPEVGERRYRPGDRSGDGRCEDIAILDVRKLMREYAAQFLWRQQLKDSGRRRDRGMLGVASRCKSIRLCLVDEIDARHGKPGALRKFPDHLIELRRGRLVDFASVVQAEHHRVRV